MKRAILMASICGAALASACTISIDGAGDDVGGGSPQPDSNEGDDNTNDQNNTGDAGTDSNDQAGTDGGEQGDDDGDDSADESES